FVLLVVSEAVTRAVDYTDRASAVLWGDGSVAAVVSTREPGRARILATTLASSPQGADHVVVPRTGHFRQDGRVVTMFAIRRPGPPRFCRCAGTTGRRTTTSPSWGWAPGSPGPAISFASRPRDMTYAEFQGQTSFSKPELLAFAHGRLVEDPPAGFEARLPLPP